MRLLSRADNYLELRIKERSSAEKIQLKERSKRNVSLKLSLISEPSSASSYVNKSNAKIRFDAKERGLYDDDDVDERSKNLWNKYKWWGLFESDE